MEKKTKRGIGIIVIITIVCMITALLLDYFNVFSCIGVNTSRLNWDFLSLVVGNIVVIALFLITYFLVDARTIQKDKNQLMTAYLILEGTYEECLTMVELFGRDDCRRSAASKCDGSKLVFDDRVHMHYMNFPFENEAIIYSCAHAGIINKDILKEYTDIKHEYQRYISMSIIFFDAYDRCKPLEKKLSERLAITIQSLKKVLDEDKG